MNHRTVCVITITIIKILGAFIDTFSVVYLHCAWIVSLLPVQCKKRRADKSINVNSAVAEFPEHISSLCGSADKMVQTHTD